jgi:hypothetical protein
LGGTRGVPGHPEFGHDVASPVMTCTARVVGHDDQILFEIPTPTFQDRIPFYHDVPVIAAEMADDSNPTMVVHTSYHVAVIDRIESLAQQLVSNDPNLWVYRVDT